MNRWMKRIVTLASLTSAVALGAGGIALAQQAQPAQPGAGHPGHHHHAKMGLFGRALALDSITPQQRTAIEALQQGNRSAEVPVRQADAMWLTALAHQVEQATIDRQALAPTVQARDSAALSARVVRMGALQKLHDILTPAQRAQLVDAVEAQAHEHSWAARMTPGDHDAHRGQRGAGLARIAGKLGLTADQKQQIAASFRAERAAEASGKPHDGLKEGRKAWLEAFRGDAFAANGANTGARLALDRHTQRIEDLVQAAVPVLTPAQRALLANQLRDRAAHESRS